MKNATTNIIHKKLILFKKRYELKNIIRGSIILVSGAVFIGVLLALSEYFFHFSSHLRMFLFWSFIGILIYTSYRYLIIHVLKYLGWANGLSNKNAAELIGEHFNEIDDQLLNLIELEEIEQKNELLLASIEQKAIKIKSFDFKEAVSFNDLSHIGKIALVPFAIVLIISFFNTQILRDGTTRIVNFSEQYTPKNPFQYKIINSDFNVVKNEDYNLSIEFIEDKVPENVFVVEDGQNLRCFKSGPNQYSYSFKGVKNSFEFHLKFEKFNTKKYTLSVIEKPTINSFAIYLNYPNYTGKKNETINNNGDLIVPIGTKAKWIFNTHKTENISLQINDSSYALKKSDDKFEHTSTIIKNQGYSIVNHGENNLVGDSLSYYISVIPDEYPKIKVQSFSDSINPYLLFNSGVVADDYGISKLQFVFNSSDTSGVVRIPLQKNALKTPFNYGINIKSLNIKPSNTLSYYFIVYDNDAISGPKYVKSAAQVFKIPSKKDVEKLIAENNQNIKSQLDNNLSKSQELQKEFNEIQQMMLNKPKLDWNDKQRISNFLKNQNDLEQKIEKLKFENDKNNYQKESLTQQEQSILEKQEKINQLFDELLDEETKKLYDELQKLMEEFKEEDIKEQLEKINLNNEALEKELDRTLELFKQMEFDQQLEEAINELEQLSEEQKQLSEETKENKNAQNLEDQQKEINEKFEEIEKKINNLEEKNNALENKREIEKTQEVQNEIKKDLNESLKNLEEQKQKKSSKKQQDAAQKMQELAKKLQNMQQQMAEQQQMEDINSLRQILENLITYSFEQEDLMKQLKSTNKFDPQFPVIATKQGDLKESVKIIEDSLQALSKRQIALETIINKEITDINYNINKSIDYLRERQIIDATVKQQYAMTAANNLALLLDESLQQMQQQMQQSKMGSGSCNKPGGSSSSPKPSMQQMQQQLSKQLEQMKEMMKKGSKPGEQGKNGKSGMAKQLAKMSAEQRAIQKQLDELQKNNKGKGGNGDLDKLQELLDNNQKDILNKNITPETIMRQEEIITKLLEADKSLRERELDDKRESFTSNRKFNRNPKDFSTYKSFEIKQEESLKTIPSSFNLFYKRKISDYFNTFEE